MVLEGSGCAARMLGLDDFEVVASEEVDGELQVLVQTPDGQVMGCHGCGVRAQSKGRRTVRVRDLPASGRPVVLVWRKRLWRCIEPLCPIKTWTEPSAHVAPRAVLTDRACAEMCRRVGQDADSVAQVARDYGVSWHTAMASVRMHGQGKVDDPARLEGVTALGMDETAWLEGHPDAFHAVCLRAGRHADRPAARRRRRSHRAGGRVLAVAS